MEKDNLKKFQKKIVTRPLKMEDFDQLVELQLKCFAGMKPWAREQLESQLSVFPDG